MAFDFLFSWYNIVFVVSLGACLVLALLQLVGGFGDHDVDLDTDIDTDIDTDASFDALSALGIGRIPILLVVMFMLGGFGAVGLLFNTLVSTFFGSYASFWFLLSLIVALIIASMFTNRMSHLVERVAPNSTTAVSFEQLIGRSGVVVNTVSTSYGRVQVKDMHGSVHTVFAIVRGGEPLPVHTEVALLSYDANKRHFIVQALSTS